MRTFVPSCSSLVLLALLLGACAAAPPPPAPVANAEPMARPWPTFTREATPPEERPRESRVLAGMTRDFKRCQGRALHDHPEATGAVRLAAKLGPSGEVVAVRSEEPQGLPPPLVSCLEKVVLSRWFAPPGGGEATIVIPVKLLPP
jgi:hypothetical protein